MAEKTITQNPRSPLVSKDSAKNSGSQKQSLSSNEVKSVNNKLTTKADAAQAALALGNDDMRTAQTSRSGSSNIFSNGGNAMARRGAADKYAEDLGLGENYFTDFRYVPESAGFWKGLETVGSGLDQFNTNLMRPIDWAFDNTMTGLDSLFNGGTGSGWGQKAADWKTAEDLSIIPSVIEDFGLAAIPYAGVPLSIAKTAIDLRQPIMQATTGKDYWTGEDLTDGQRAINAGASLAGLALAGFGAKGVSNAAAKRAGSRALTGSVDDVMKKAEGVVGKEGTFAGARNASLRELEELGLPKAGSVVEDTLVPAGMDASDVANLYADTVYRTTARTNPYNVSQLLDRNGNVIKEAKELPEAVRRIADTDPEVSRIRAAMSEPGANTAKLQAELDRRFADIQNEVFKTQRGTIKAEHIESFEKGKGKRASAKQKEIEKIQKQLAEAREIQEEAAKANDEFIKAGANVEKAQAAKDRYDSAIKKLQKKYDDAQASYNSLVSSQQGVLSKGQSVNPMVESQAGVLRDEMSNATNAINARDAERLASEGSIYDAQMAQQAARDRGQQSVVRANDFYANNPEFTSIKDAEDAIARLTSDLERLQASAPGETRAMRGIDQALEAVAGNRKIANADLMRATGRELSDLESQAGIIGGRLSRDLPRYGIFRNAPSTAEGKLFGKGELESAVEAAGKRNAYKDAYTKAVESGLDEKTAIAQAIDAARGYTRTTPEFEAKGLFNKIPAVRRFNEGRFNRRMPEDLDNMLPGFKGNTAGIRQFMLNNAMNAANMPLQLSAAMGADSGGFGEDFNYLMSADPEAVYMMLASGLLNLPRNTARRNFINPATLGAYSSDVQTKTINDALNGNYYNPDTLEELRNLIAEDNLEDATEVGE